MPSLGIIILRKSKDIMVDAYEFRSWYILGYIAFFYNEKTKIWTIKSFKRSENSNMAMDIAFKKASLKIENKLGEKNE